jgi:two-component system, NarL family, nitrate/nitrite response regulator NarL
MGLRCLIVDDSPGFLQAARALLEQEGMTVVGVASTSEAAIEHAVRQCPDVTLVDIDLGGSSGLDLARRLVSECGASAGCLILISAHAEEEFADLIEASPAAGFLPKDALSADAITELLPGGRDGPVGTSAPQGTL